MLSTRTTLARLECRGGMDDSSGSVIAQIEEPKAPQTRVFGWRFGSLCDAPLGDARCGLSIRATSDWMCNKSSNECHDTFDEAVNYRGFPDLPGEDVLTDQVRESDALDDGSHGQGFVR